MASRIYINPEDDINTVINKVVSGKESNVQLVVPSGARILQNIVDAYLLRDATLAQAKTVTIVTNDIMGKIFAERAGMSVANSETDDGDFFVSEAMAKMADIVPKKKRSKSTTAKKVSEKLTEKKTLKKVSAKKMPAKAVAKKLAPAKGVASRASKKLASPGASPTRKFLPRAPLAVGPNKGASKENKFLRAYRRDMASSNGLSDLGTSANAAAGTGGFKKRFSLSTSKLVLIVLVVALVVAVFVFGKVLPKSDIVVYPVRETASFNVEVFVDKGRSDVRVEEGIIPGEVFTKEEISTDVFSSSGLEDVNVKAGGTIIIFNEFSSSPQRFIPSRFESSDGKIFWTVEGVIVPGANIEGGNTTPGQIEAKVLAAEPGEAYNIGPGRFTMPALKGSDRFDKFYAVSGSAMSGGQTGQAIVVSQGDIDNAYSSLQAKVDPALKDFRQNLPEGLVLWEEAYNEETAERSSDRDSGQPADEFSATLKKVARAITFRQVDLDSLLESEISSRLSQDQTILPSSKEITFLKPPVVDYQQGTIFTTLQVKVDVIQSLDSDVFRGAVLKKNKDEIKQILPNFKGIERVEVKLWPFWVKRVPKNLDRVNVEIFGL